MANFSDHLLTVSSVVIGQPCFENFLSCFSSKLHVGSQEKLLTSTELGDH